MENLLSLKPVGPVSSHIQWMIREGFFSKHPEWADTTFILPIKDEYLSCVDLLGTESDCEEYKDDEKIQDVLMAIIMVESVCFNALEPDEEFTFTDDDLNKWASKYGISSIMEAGRRKGIYFITNENAPLNEVRWGLTELGKQVAKALAINEENKEN